MSIASLESPYPLPSATIEMLYAADIPHKVILKSNTYAMFTIYHKSIVHFYFFNTHKCMYLFY